MQQLLERPSETSSEQLSLILRILEEKRKLKEEERRDKELQLEIVKAMTGVSQSQGWLKRKPVNRVTASSHSVPFSRNYHWTDQPNTGSCIPLPSSSRSSVKC